jgi:hypothetical protein
MLLVNRLSALSGGRHTAGGACPRSRRSSVETQVGRYVALASQCRPHAQVVACGRDIVHTKDRGPAVDRFAKHRERAGEPLPRRAPG